MLKNSVNLNLIGHRFGNNLCPKKRSGEVENSHFLFIKSSCKAIAVIQKLIYYIAIFFLFYYCVCSNQKVGSLVFSGLHRQIINRTPRTEDIKMLKFLFSAFFALYLGTAISTAAEIQLESNRVLLVIDGQWQDPGL